MNRTRFSLLAVFVLALTILLGGCGGGGGKGGTNGGDTGGNTGGTTVGRAVVKFFGPTGNVPLGSGEIASNGKFPTTVPAGATRFSIDPSAVTDANGNHLYYDTYAFNGGFFDDGLGCYAALPQAGSSAGIQGNLVYFLRASSPPPPPPSGCVGG